MLNINSAIPCGLIINELITNTLKHAFPNNAEGTLQIMMRKKESGNFVLEVRDSGIGFPADIDPNQVITLGLQLITSLVQQLNGTMKYTGCDGTCFKLEFSQK
ncbi:MAG: sensor histidine kinase [Candidatus Cloacimonadales bacterium]|nr:sensor histidine kinase [Candidatus Cloacimonadales bacterium]